MIRSVPSQALPSVPETVPALPDPRPSVSAIVLNRDGADHLANLFTSLWPAVAAWLDEIIVIDHGSRDDSLDVCAAWSDRLPVRCVAFRRNHSFSWSTNRAAERASGDYLLLLNNDVRFGDNPLPAMLAVAQATRGAVGAGQQHVALDGSRKGAPSIGVRLTWDARAAALRPKEIVPGPCDAGRAEALAVMPAVTASVLVVARTTYLRLGGLDEGYDYGYEDVDFALRLMLARGRAVTSLNGADVRHLEGGTRRRLKVWARARRLMRNRRRFRERWAHPAWCWWRRAVLQDPGAMVGRRLAARIGPDPKRLPAFGFDAPTLASWRAVAGDEAPEVLVIDAPGQAAFSGGGTPLLAVLACLTAADLPAWRGTGLLSGLDLVVVTDATHADELRNAGAPAVATGGDVARDGWLAHAARGPRVGIVAGLLGAKRTRVAEAVQRIAAAGHPVRVARTAGALVPWADVMVEAAGPTVGWRGPPGAPRLPLGSPETIVSRVRAADAQARRPPEDPALTDHSGAAFPDA